MKAGIQIIIDGIHYWALKPEEYQDYLQLREYILGGKIDDKALVLVGPHSCDNRWIYLKEKDEALRDAAYINEALEEERDKYKKQYELLRDEYYQLESKYSEKKSILDHILGR